MKIKDELNKLQDSDIYSILLFALYKMTNDSQHAALSQMAYILDKDNLLKLCEFFGGMTLKIPTIEELESLTYSLLLYQLVDIEHNDIELTVKEFELKKLDTRRVLDQYYGLREILKNYSFNSGRN